MEWERVIWVAIGIVGAIEFIKQPFSGRPVPGWVWWALQGLACVGMGIIGGGTPAGMAEHALIYVAVTALGYGTLVKLVQTMIDQVKLNKQ